MSIAASGRMAEGPRWWVPGDWNGFFGLFTNVLLNVIVLTGLCLGVVQMPGDVVYGRILPALGIALPLGNLYYAYLAWRLGQREQRSDVTAMPYGPSVPHMFIVVFLIMLPVYLKTKDPVLAWQSGLVWCLVIGIIVLLGAFVGPAIRRFTPRAAMLGTLAGISIAFISMRPAFLGWEEPWLFLMSFAIVLISWTAGVRLPYGLPGGLAAVAVGTVLAWLARLFHLDMLMEPAAVGARIGYSLATGVVIGLVCFLGLTALLLAVIPLVAILPILLFIGLVIGAQSFQATPSRHAPAVVLALLPNIAAWCQTQIDGALGAAGTSAEQVGMAKLAGTGVVYRGMELLGGGAVLAGLILGAIAAFIIDRRFDRAAIYAGAGAVLAFFGFINGTALGIGNSAPVAFGYLLVALICLGLSLQGQYVPI